jgi:hypothetical protein
MMHFGRIQIVGKVAKNPNISQVRKIFFKGTQGKSKFIIPFGRNQELDNIIVHVFEFSSLKITWTPAGRYLLNYLLKYSESIILWEYP